MEKAKIGRINRYSETVITVDEAITIMQNGNSIDGAIIDSAFEIEKFNEFSSHILSKDVRVREESKDLTVDEYHHMHSNVWKFPEKYREIDVLDLLLSRCSSETEKERVKTEFEMFKERNLEVLLQLLIWLVDHMRENNIMWGVGRGSSVASFCLYLIGINRVNPLIYDLDIGEFLK
jgi:DNA polymerase III alpha subunit